MLPSSILHAYQIHFGDDFTHLRQAPAPKLENKCIPETYSTHHILVLVVFLVCHTVGVPAKAIMDI
jgi:hypothetical protein